jgi:hypothetical protein
MKPRAIQFGVGVSVVVSPSKLRPMATTTLRSLIFFFAFLFSFRSTRRKGIGQRRLEKKKSGQASIPPIKYRVLGRPAKPAAAREAAARAAAVAVIATKTVAAAGAGYIKVSSLIILRTKRQKKQVKSS